MLSARRCFLDPTPRLSHPASPQSEVTSSTVSGYIRPCADCESLNLDTPVR